MTRAILAAAVVLPILGLFAACGGGGASSESSGSGGAATSASSVTASSSSVSTSSSASSGTGGMEPMDAGPDGKPGGQPACQSGATQSNSGGLEGPLGTAVVNLCRRAIGCNSPWNPVPPSPLNGGTPNQKLLWHVYDYGYALEFLGAKAQQTARDGLVAFFDAQKTFGHYAPTANANEVLTTSHYEIWSNGMTCARLLSIVYADAIVVSATGGWWHGERALYDLLQRGGSIDAPGARFPAGGTGGPNQLRDTIYALLSGAPLPGNAAKPNSPWWSDYYNVGAWQLREVLRLGDDVGGATSMLGVADLPNLRDPLTVSTSGNDWVFEFKVMRGALNPLFWVAHINGQTTYAPIVKGTPVNEATPPPDLPGAQVVVVPGSP